MTDTEYLLSKNQNATAAQVEAFCERVAIMLCYSTLNEDDVRYLAYASN
jgi:hypothetical protein